MGTFMSYYEAGVTWRRVCKNIERKIYTFLRKFLNWHLTIIFYFWRIRFHYSANFARKCFHFSIQLYKSFLSLYSGQVLLLLPTIVQRYFYPNQVIWYLMSFYSLQFRCFCHHSFWWKKKYLNELFCKPWSVIDKPFFRSLILTRKPCS